jgi:TolB-like protein
MKRFRCSAALVGMLILGPPAALAQPQAAPPAAPALPADRPTVAVLNFANADPGDPRWDWLSKGLADLTIGDLASQGLHVVSREQMQEMIHELKLKKEQTDPAAIARVLKAARCVHGTYRVTDGKVELNASILEVATGRQQHTAAVAGAEADLLGLQKKLAAELADVLQGNKAGTIDPAKLPKWTESLKASELLYQGIDLFDRGEYLTAWGLFRRALRQDARYADALYWLGRMMYYVQEYHQARLDLERFAVEHPKHQRAGDAVMEIISAAQLTAPDAAEVLRVLTLAAKLAPDAEVPNQFGVGYSSTVGLYSAGLAAQILRSQGRYREAFEWLGEQIKALPNGHPLYWIAWHENVHTDSAALKSHWRIARNAA